MKRMTASYRGKKGFPPGTLTHVGTIYEEKIRVRQTSFDPAGADSRDLERWQDLLPFRNDRAVAWIEINGIHDVQAIEEIGRHFSIHPLVLEDILNTTQRPKFEEFDDYLFLVAKVPFAQHPSESSAGSTSRSTPV